MTPFFIRQFISSAAFLVGIGAARAADAPTLDQFIWQSPGTQYVYGASGVIPNIPIADAPADADWTRWTMLHDASDYRLYVFKQGSNSIYQFAFDGSAYRWGYHSIPVVTLASVPADADLDHFAMLWDGAMYRLYVQKRGAPVLYQAAWVAGSGKYVFGYRSIPQIPVTDLPADADWTDWAMLHDGRTYRFYAMQKGSTTEFYQAAWNGAAYQYANNSIPILTVANAPAGEANGFGMLYADGLYHLYRLRGGVM